MPQDRTEQNQELLMLNSNIWNYLSMCEQMMNIDKYWIN